VRSLLQVIADFTNFNIITSDSVTGTLTLRLQDVPWDQALDIILQAKGLGMRKTGNVLWIAPKRRDGAKEKLELEAQPRCRTWSRCARSRSRSTTPRRPRSRPA
jgi:type IV pilus assembly protein PilQ